MKELPSQSMLICPLANVGWCVQMKYSALERGLQCCPALVTQILHFLGTPAVPHEHIWALSRNTGVPQDKQQLVECTLQK